MREIRFLQLAALVGAGVLASPQFKQLVERPQEDPEMAYLPLPEKEEDDTHANRRRR